MSFENEQFTFVDNYYMDKIVGLSDVLISLINNVLMGNLQKIIPFFHHPCRRMNVLMSISFLSGLSFCQVRERRLLTDAVLIPNKIASSLKLRSKKLK